MRRGRTLGLVPAKIGSTRLPRKNLLPLGGVSLVGRAVLAGLRSDRCDALVVSTDDEEIAVEARRYGAEVPFLRPAALGRDPAGVVEVALHALDALAEQGRAFDTIVLLLPTSPLRRPQDVAAAVDAYDAADTPFLLTVVDAGVAPLRALVVGENARALPLHPEWVHLTGARAGDFLPRLVRHDGAVSVANVAALRTARSFMGQPLAVHRLPAEREIDVDTPADFARAELALASGVADWIAAEDRPITET